MTSNNALAVVDKTAQVIDVSGGDFMPVFNIEMAVRRRDTMLEFVKKIMVDGTDFGTIPGTPKPSLLKPGAEKLCSFFGLSPEFILIERTEDWMGAEHSGEPFFYYLYKCVLSRNGRVIGAGDGSCNSWESKYRYRSADRVCPSCGKAAIIKGKAEYGGGFVCFAKKGGCNAKFKENDAAITGQPTGKVANPDIADIVNTLQKMAQKRSLIAATLIGVNASEYFTQDIEDMQPIAPEIHEPIPQEQAPAPSTPQRTKKAAPFDAPAMRGMLLAMKQQIGAERFFRILGAEGFESVADISTRHDGERIYRMFKAEAEHQKLGLNHADVVDAEVVNG